ncbi:hypothetical protein LTR94_025059, partial [Friedmanniomyces endolithicus]
MGATPATAQAGHAAPSALSAPQAGSTSSASAEAVLARAQGLLAQMTQDEKLQLIHGYFPPFAS